MRFDYSTITAEQVGQITDDAITRADAIVARAVAADPSLDETLLPIDEAAAIISTAAGEAAFMGEVHPDADVRAAGRAADERLQTWRVDLIFRDDVYRAIRTFADSDEAAALTGEPERLLEFTLRDLRKAGHELDPETRDEVKAISTRLVELGVRFAQYLAEYDDHLSVSAADLDGLPDDYIERLKPGDEDGTFKVTMAYPDVIPFMENAARRDLREQLSFRFNNRAVEDNRAILEEAVRLRQRVAELFGEPSWADHKMDDQMAQNPENVQVFYDELRPPLTDKARAEIDVMAGLLRSDTGDSQLQVWDWRYYDTQLRKQDYGVDPHEVAAYFPLEQVLDGLLTITGEVFGLDYRMVDDVPVWHRDVVVYAIDDRASGEEIAHVYMDLHPRDGKFSHAAAFDIVPGRRRPDGTYQEPASAIVANLTKPTADRPSLLQHDEVVTLFHEFGHVMHQTLTRAELTRFSGTNTERDFVEAPSQIMEHWCWNADVLARFARHHRTGEPIPEQLVRQLVAARNLNVGVANLRQIHFGVLDLDLHGPGADKDLDAIHRRAVELTLLPFHDGTFFPATFGHLMGGYDAGYYGYLWSEVFGDDMFSRFEEEGITSAAVGAAFRREILEKGGALDGDEMLRSFLGREPDNRAFLRKLGITTEAAP
ncbi:MAG: M3 family metallopeptidase [Acidimicrobiales bacterium]